MIRAEIGLKKRQIINETYAFIVSWFYKIFTPTTILVTIFHICTCDDVTLVNGKSIVSWKYMKSNKKCVFNVRFCMSNNSVGYLPWANIRICPQISISALIYPYLPPNSTSGICAVVSTYKERWCMEICIKSYFNQINTFQHIGINLNN